MQLLPFEVQLPKSISGRIIETPQTFMLRYLKEKDTLRIKFEESQKYLWITKDPQQQRNFFNWALLSI